VSCSPVPTRARTSRTLNPRRPSCSSRLLGCRWRWNGSKKVSAALTPVTRANWSITTTPSSASAGNAYCWGCRGPRFTTGRFRCVKPHCGSWPGLVLCTWGIPVVGVAGSWNNWPERGTRSVVIESESSCGAWVYERSTRSHAQRFQESHRSAFTTCWTSCWSRLWIRAGRPTSPISRRRRDSSTRW